MPQILCWSGLPRPLAKNSQHTDLPSSVLSSHQPDEAGGEIHSFSSPCKLAYIKVTILSPIPHTSVASELPGLRPRCPLPQPWIP